MDEQLRTRIPGMAVVRRALLLVVMTLGLVVAIPSVASAAAPTCDPSQFNHDGSFDVTAYLLCKNPRTSVQEAVPGAPVSFQAAGFRSNSVVAIYLHIVGCGDGPECKVYIGDATVDENGILQYDFLLPSGIAEGEYEILADGIGPDGSPNVVTSPPINVVADNSSQTLPYTGSNSLRLTTIGAALFVLGGIGVWSARRLRSATR